MDTEPEGLAARWRALPLATRAYFVCALGASILFLSILYDHEFYEWLIQWTGWMGLLCYLIGVWHIGCYLATGATDGLRRLPLLMAAFAGLGLAEHFIEHGDPDRFVDTNPYLRVHPWRPLVTIVAPALWALVLFASARARRWWPPLAPRATDAAA